MPVRPASGRPAAAEPANPSTTQQTQAAWPASARFKGPAGMAQKIILFGCPFDCDEKHDAIVEKQSGVGLKQMSDDPLDAVIDLLESRVPANLLAKCGIDRCRRHGCALSRPLSPGRKSTRRNSWHSSTATAAAKWPPGGNICQRRPSCRTFPAWWRWTTA